MKVKENNLNNFHFEALSSSQTLTRILKSDNFSLVMRCSIATVWIGSVVAAQPTTNLSHKSNQCLSLNVNMCLSLTPLAHINFSLLQYLPKMQQDCVTYHLRTFFQQSSNCFRKYQKCFNTENWYALWLLCALAKQ